MVDNDAALLEASLRREEARRSVKDKRYEYAARVKANFLPKIMVDEGKRSQIISRILATQERPLSALQRATSATPRPRVDIHSLFSDKGISRDASAFGSRFDEGLGEVASSGYAAPQRKPRVSSASARRMGGGRPEGVRLPDINGGGGDGYGASAGYTGGDAATADSIRHKLAMLAANELGDRS